MSFLRGKMTQDKGDIVIYQTDSGQCRIDVKLEDETVWLTQDQISTLFNKAKSTINEHIKNIFEDGELDEKVVMRKFGISEFSTKPTNFYNLDTIISVGYRVKSSQGIKFRLWASSILKEYMKKGFVLDDERLKQGKSVFNKDYFKELLERVRSIRASERRIWQQITDIFAECSLDYDKNSLITKEFYSMIQNKFHYAITKQTAAEIIYSKSDSNVNNMGLTTWKNSPNGRILKSDVTIAKNYLSEKEIIRLERAIIGYFDYIEDLIEREHTFTMEEFSESVNKFLAFRKYDILSHKGKVSKKEADEKAEKEYDKFNKIQKIESDFDREIKEVIKKYEKEK